ncbi:MAG: GNAT family N-acetyltransferase [Casimicrobiaceae bacterium]
MMYSIRPLGPEDAEVYHALRLRMLREHPEAFTSSFEEASSKPLAWAEARLTPATGAPEKFVLGAFAGDDELIGSVGMAVEERLKERHKGFVFGMFVAPEAGAAGVGRALLADCIARARRVPGLELLTLTVTSSNLRALQFYQAAGFRAFGIEQRAIKVAGIHYPKAHMMFDLLA